MSIKPYIKRVIRYIFSGIPTCQINVQVVQLASSGLLKGKKALITGGTSGIGRAIAVAFIRAGADVIITSRSQKKVDQCVEGIRKTNDCNSHIYGIKLDTRDINTFKDMLKEIETPPNIGKIDILVNNAGINKSRDGQTTIETYNLIASGDWQYIDDSHISRVASILLYVTYIMYAYSREYRFFALFMA